MATLELIKPVACAENGCDRRATVRVVDGKGKPVADLCATHGTKRLRIVAKEEGNRA